MNLGELTMELVLPLVGTSFEIASADGGVVRLTLDEALPFELRQRRARAPSTPRRVPFSLYFVGPRTAVLPQAMYTLRSAAVTLENLFLVPIGADDETVEYEAVFN